MKMSRIIRSLELARDEYDYGYVEVTIPGQEGTEIIINRKQSLDNKIAFYKKAYDENGVHCMNSAVRIVSAGAVSNMYRIDLTDLDDEVEEEKRICRISKRSCRGIAECPYAESEDCE